MAAKTRNQPLYVAAAWIEAHCVIPDGFKKGKPFKLYRYQGTFILNHYLVKHTARWVPDNPELRAAFVHMRSILVGPQKMGKNPLIAAQVCLEAVGPALFAGWAKRGDGYVCSDWGCGCGWDYPYGQGEPMGMPWPTPLIQITAFSQDSTDNTYDALRPMIEEGPLSDRMPKTGEEFIRIDTDGRIDTVTSSAKSRLGQRVTFVPQDEVGLWTHENKMIGLAQTQWRGLSGMGGRAALTTNMWDQSQISVGRSNWESGSPKIYCQGAIPPPDLDFAKRADRQKIYRVAYPAEVLRENKGHIDLRSIEDEAVELMKTDSPQAARFYGNVRMAGVGKAVEPSRWAELAKRRGDALRVDQLTLDAMRDFDRLALDVKTRIGVGFDGSISDDATVLRGCTEDGYTFLLGAWARPAGRADWRVPRDEVNAIVSHTFEYFDVGRMICDPPKWYTEIGVWEQDYTDDVVIRLETYKDSRFAPAVDRWLTAIAEGDHTHDDDPTTNEHVANAYKRKANLRADETDGRTLYTLTKGADKAKIDAAVADVLALEAAMSMPVAKPKTMNIW